MAVTLTYDSTNARVSVAATVLGSDATFALVERSQDSGATYEQVRAASEWPVSASALTSTLYDYEFSSSVVNTYRVTPYDGTNFPQDTALNGLILDGTSGDYASTPDAASLDITGDLELIADITPRDWTPSADQTLIGKWNTTGNQRSYMLQLDNSGGLQLSWSVDGTAELNVTSSAIPASSIPASGRLAVRATIDVNDGAGNRVIKFYTATSISGTWTQLGSTTTTVGTTSIFSGTATGGVGARNAGAGDRFAGVIHAAKIVSGLAGTEVANPVFTSQSNGATSFADTATPAKTWTINGAAEVRVPQTNTVTPTLTSIWLKSPIRPFLNREVRVVGLEPITRSNKNGVFSVMGRSYPVVVTDVRPSRAFTATIRTDTRTEAEEMDLILASGDSMFFHSPPSQDHWWMPDRLFCIVNDITETRLGIRTGVLMDFGLACQEVGRPDPDIAYNTITWASIVASYATWDDHMDAFADWGDVIDDYGSASDVIVP